MQERPSSRVPKQERGNDAYRKVLNSYVCFYPDCFASFLILSDFLRVSLADKALDVLAFRFYSDFLRVSVANRF